MSDFLKRISCCLKPPPLQSSDNTSEMGDASKENKGHDSQVDSDRACRYCVTAILGVMWGTSILTKDEQLASQGVSSACFLAFCKRATHVASQLGQPLAPPPQSAITQMDQEIVPPVTAFTRPITPTTLIQVEQDVQVELSQPATTTIAPLDQDAPSTTINPSVLVNSGGDDGNDDGDDDGFDMVELEN